MRSRAWRVLAIGAVAVVAACPGSDSEYASQGPGVNHEPRACIFADVFGFNASGAAAIVVPTNCPVVYHDTNVTVHYSVVTELPYGAQENPYTPSDEFIVNDTYTGQHFIAESNLQFMTYDSTYNAWTDILTATGQPAKYRNPSNAVQLRDSITLAFGSTRFGSDGTVEAYALVPGDTTSVQQILSGPNGAIAGVPTTWYAVSDWDSSAYNFEWSADGGGFVAGDYATATFGSAGTHTLVSIARRMDGTADTVTKSLEVFDAAISGPNSVQPSATCEWTVAVSGGTAPYTYSWSAPGATGSDAFFDYSNTASDGGAFTLSVSVTDAVGAGGTISKQVSVASGARTCSF